MLTVERDLDELDVQRLADASPSPPLSSVWDDFTAPDRRRIKRSIGWGTLFGFVPFLLILWDFGLHPLRTALALRFGSNFYDIQARALLDGNLAVPVNSLGIEGFVVHGRTFMYFPPFPAFLRLPVMMFTERFDGRLTAPSMLLAWFVLAAATATLIWSLRALMRPGAPVTRVEATVLGILLATVTGGSIVIYLASLPWVYHEVYMWGSAFAIATLAGVVTLVRHPHRTVIVLTLAAALGAILTRTTSGWAMALTVIASGVAMGVRAPLARGRAHSLVVGGIVVLAIGVTINWVKFRHPYMFPLGDQVWTAENSRRRLALAMNGGSITGPQFLTTSLVNYFRPDGLRFVSYFPFITLPAHPARSYGAFLDQTYRTGSVPALMPLLFGSCLWGFVSTFRPRPRAGLASARLPILGALAITAGVMGYGYVANRYTSEFLPVLVITAAVGLIDVSRRVERCGGLTRPAVVSMVALLAVFGCLANTATGFAAARLARRGEDLERYVDVQAVVADLTGGAFNDLVVHSTTLPTDAPTDELRIVGNCDGLYIGSGDQYEPWITVQARERIIDIRAAHDGAAAVLPLVTIEGNDRQHIALETDGDGQGRLRFGTDVYFLPTDWFRLDPGDQATLRISADTERDRFDVSLSDRYEGHVAAAEWDRDWHVVVATAAFDLPSDAEQERAGVTLTPSLGPPLALCNRLLDRAG